MNDADPSAHTQGGQADQPGQSAETTQTGQPALTDEAPICSARGCRAEAVWELRWNNPRLHEPERRKVWLACDAHRASLADFLAARSFLRDVVPVNARP